MQRCNIPFALLWRLAMTVSVARCLLLLPNMKLAGAAEVSIRYGGVRKPCGGEHVLELTGAVHVHMRLLEHAQQKIGELHHRPVCRRVEYDERAIGLENAVDFQ